MLRSEAPLRRVVLAFVGVPQVTELAGNQYLRRRAEAVHEQHAVQMIQLVLPRARRNAFGFQFYSFTVELRGAHTHLLCTPDFGEHAGHTQATFLFENPAFTPDNERIDERLFAARFQGCVEQYESERPAHLWRGQSDSLLLTYQLGHARSHLIEEAVDLGQRLGPFPQYRRRVMEDMQLVQIGIVHVSWPVNRL